MEETRQILDRIRTQTKNATEGLWEAFGTAILALTGPGDCKGCSGIPSPEHEPACYYSEIAGASEEDAAHIATLHNAAPHLITALEKVLDRHQPVDEEVIDQDCVDGECYHEDDEHPLRTMKLCKECYRFAHIVNSYYGEDGYSAVLWPCPNVTDITESIAPILGQLGLTAEPTQN